MRDLIGHASILTTERYDNQRLEALQTAVRLLDTGKTFDPVRLKPDTTYYDCGRLVRRSGFGRFSRWRKFQESFKSSPEQSFARSEDRAKDSAEITELLAS